MFCDLQNIALPKRICKEFNLIIYCIDHQLIKERNKLNVSINNNKSLQIISLHEKFMAIMSEPNSSRNFLYSVHYNYELQRENIKFSNEDLLHITDNKIGPKIGINEWVNQPLSTISHHLPTLNHER